MKLDERQAFEAMRIYLQQFWEETKGSAEVGEVLSDIQIESDGDTHDPAAWHEWLKAVARVLDDPSSASE